MPGYAKFMKHMVTEKRSVSFEDDDWMQHCIVIARRSLVQKKEDPGAFTIPCTTGLLHFAKALCDLGGNINLMPFSIYKKLDLGDLKPTLMLLLMDDRTVKRPIGILHDVLVKVDFKLNNKDATFNICRSMKKSGELQTVSAISYKQKMKKYHDLKIEKRDFMVGELVLLYNSRLHLFQGKLKSKWTGPYLINYYSPWSS